MFDDYNKVNTKNCSFSFIRAGELYKILQNLYYIHVPKYNLVKNVPPKSFS